MPPKIFLKISEIKSITLISSIKITLKYVLFSRKEKKRYKIKYGKVQNRKRNEIKREIKIRKEIKNKKRNVIKNIRKETK